MGKIIVLEGTDGSGKETQGKLLEKKLNEENIKAIYFSFPCYEEPTGKIISASLGKMPFNGEKLFSEGFDKAPYKVASMLYALDRKYNISKINDKLNEGFNVILDRYTYSNMAHQGGKISDKKSRLTCYKWLEELEFNMLELPKPDIKIFLHVPLNITNELKKLRAEILDDHEKNDEHLKMAEIAYLEIVKLYDFYYVNCVNNNEMRSKEDINNEIYTYVERILFE
jgi:dTMP kinase